MIRPDPYSRVWKGKYKHVNENYHSQKYREYLALDIFARPQPQTEKARKFNPAASLLRLPPEIRLQIFGYLLKSEHPIQIYHEVNTFCYSYYREWQQPNLPRIAQARGLWYSCRQISDEALSILYSNTFHLNLKRNGSRLWLLTIGPRNRNRITKLGLDTILSSTSDAQWAREREFKRLSIEMGLMENLREVDYHVRTLQLQHNFGRYEDQTQFAVHSEDLYSFHENLLYKYSVYTRPENTPLYWPERSRAVWLTAQ